MKIPFRTFALFSVAFGMLAAGYLIGPAPGAPSSPRPQEAKAVPNSAPVSSAAKPTLSTVVANRPPVPLVPQQRTSYFTPAEPSPERSGDKPAADADQAQTQALATDQPAGDDGQARRAIEFDGYKNVHAIVKGADGVWHARAMRGRTEVAVRVDGSGNVSAE
jgi:hypothetical protein